MSNYIAILSSTHPCSERNKAIASETGKEIVLLGFSLAAGNLSGTPKYAFQSAKQNNGITLAIIEQTQHFYDHQYCDILEVVPNIDNSQEPPLPMGIAGNSAYIIRPFAAKELLKTTKELGVWPNDAIMCKQLFPWLRVVYPYYSTTQRNVSTTTQVA